MVIEEPVRTPVTNFLKKSQSGEIKKYPMIVISSAVNNKKPSRRTKEQRKKSGGLKSSFT